MEYENRRKNIDDLLRALAVHFETTRLPPPPAIGPVYPFSPPPIVDLARGIHEEIGPLLRKQPEEGTTECKVQAEGVDEQVKVLPDDPVQYLHIAAKRKHEAMGHNRRSVYLNRLLHESEAWHSPMDIEAERRNGCAPDTRVDILQEIRGWIRYSHQTVYWLNGTNGTGKTTIAWSLCESLEVSVYPVASFFCARQRSSCRNASYILPDISYQLCLKSHPYRSALSEAVNQDVDPRQWPIHDQFEKLIATPLRKVGHTFRAHVIVVIDALDECEDSGAVEQVLDAILSRTHGLPIKFFVTSRPVHTFTDLMYGYQSKNLLEVICLHQLHCTVYQREIRTYLLSGLEINDPSTNGVDTLCEWSGMSFRRAAIFVNYILRGDSLQATKRMQQLLGPARVSEADAMYSAMLDSAFDYHASDEPELAVVKLVLHTIVINGGSFTVDVLAGLLGLRTAMDVTLQTKAGS
ncbi:hypothetical protein FRC07_001351 [Ceratobasidium sp. 392]|nr:hypothetical protein FRC07_001351 [Ceratobasidium sp. 392]